MTATVTLPYEEYQALKTRLEMLERADIFRQLQILALEARVQTLQGENASTTSTTMRGGTIPRRDLGFFGATKGKGVFTPERVQGQPVTVPTTWTYAWPDRRVRKYT